MKLQINSRKAFLLFLCLLFLNTLKAQESEKIDFPELGISFHVPEGWAGTAVASGFAITSPKTEGVLLIITHDVQSIQEMEIETKNGFKVGGNTLLKPIKSVEKISENTIAGIYEGVIDAKPSKALIVGMVHRYGYGLTLLCAASSSAYSENLQNAGLWVTASVNFYEPQAQTTAMTSHANHSTWGERLKNCHLIYMESYNTSGGGYGKKIKIDLCGQGYFNHSAYNRMGIDTGGAIARYGGNNKGTGHWKTYVNAQEQDVLQLNFTMGRFMSIL